MWPRFAHALPRKLPVLFARSCRDRSSRATWPHSRRPLTRGGAPHARGSFDASIGSLRWFDQLDGSPVRVFELHSASGGAGFNGVTENEARSAPWPARRPADRERRERYDSTRLAPAFVHPPRVADPKRRARSAGHDAAQRQRGELRQVHVFAPCIPGARYRRQARDSRR